jgi:hypothetical protein
MARQPCAAAILTPSRDPDEKLTLAELCKELKIRRSSSYDWRAKGRAPQCFKLPNGELRITFGASSVMRPRSCTRLAARRPAGSTGPDAPGGIAAETDAYHCRERVTARLPAPAIDRLLAEQLNDASNPAFQRACPEPTSSTHTTTYERATG